MRNLALFVRAPFVHMGVFLIEYGDGDGCVFGCRHVYVCVCICASNTTVGTCCAKWLILIFVLYVSNLVVLVAGAFQLKRAYEALAIQEDVVAYLAGDDVKKAAVARTLAKILHFGSESKYICCVLAQTGFRVQGRARVAHGDSVGMYMGTCRTIY